MGKVYGSGEGGHRKWLGVGMSGFDEGGGREGVRKVVVHTSWGRSQRAGRCEEEVGWVGTAGMGVGGVRGSDILA